ncbi:MAG: hypothetical protein Q8Q33_08060, partial [Chlamydiota bacterium]|nr:hypothetical protein [Chlamydiota bacterium]
MIAKLKIPLIIIISFFLLMLIVRIIKDANNSSVVSSRIADYIVDEGLRDTYKKVSKLRDGGPQRKIDRHAPDVTTEVLSDTDESNDNAAFSTNIEEDNFLELMKPVDSPFQ